MDSIILVFIKIFLLDTKIDSNIFSLFILKGYVIYSVRKKLKKQYTHLKGTQIKKLKLTGVEVIHFQN